MADAMHKTMLFKLKASCLLSSSAVYNNSRGFAQLSAAGASTLTWTRALASLKPSAARVRVATNGQPVRDVCKPAVSKFPRNFG